MARRFNTSIDFNGIGRVINMPVSTANGQAVAHEQLAAKQDAITIAAGSSSFLELTAGELSVKNLLISSVSVDASETTLAGFVTAVYDGSNYQEGDTVVLSLASPVETYIHNGGSAGTTADFTLINAGGASAATIHALFSAGAGLGYNDSTGEFFIEADGITESMLDSSVDAETFLLDTGYAFTDATSSPNFPAVGDSVQTAVEKLDGDVRFIITAVSAINPPSKYSADVTLVADTPLTVTHSLGTTDIVCQVRDSSGNYVTLDIDTVDVNSLTLTSDAALTAARVMVLGL